MAFKNIIFDLDGTLIDSARVTGLIIDQMLADRGSPGSADRAVIRAMDAVGGEAMITAVMGAYVQNPGADLEEFRARHRLICVPDDLAFPGVVEGLEAIHRSGTRLAICSNKPQYLCERILRDLRLDRLFATIIGSDAGRPRKPAPDAALRALAGVGGNTANTVYCGDSQIDVLTARAVGLPVVLVEWGYGTADAIRDEPGLPRAETMSCLVEIIHGVRELGPLFHR